MKTLTWDSVVLLHGQSVPMASLGQMISIISEIASVATFDLGANPSESINGLLKDLPARQLGYKFMVLTKEASVSSIHAAVTIFDQYC